MARLAVNVVLAHPNGGEPAVLLAGSDVPEWAEGLVGDHALEPSDAEGGYGSLTKAQLVDEIEKRNSGRDEADRLAATGTKAELVEVLVADDARP